MYKYIAYIADIFCLERDCIINNIKCDVAYDARSVNIYILRWTYEICLAVECDRD